MEASGPRKAEGLPKLRDLLRRQREDSFSESMCETPDIEYTYDDADTYRAEMAELYSYTEESEFVETRKAFEHGFALKGHDKWTTASPEIQRKHIVFLQNELEMADRDRRFNALMALLYLLQGVHGECDAEDQQRDWVMTNVHMLYEQGLFISFAEVLSMEIENTAAASNALRKPAVSVADSKDLRVKRSVYCCGLSNNVVLSLSCYKEQTAVNTLVHPVIDTGPITCVTIDSQASRNYRAHHKTGTRRYQPQGSSITVKWSTS